VSSQIHVPATLLKGKEPPVPTAKEATHKKLQLGWWDFHSLQHFDAPNAAK